MRKNGDRILALVNGLYAAAKLAWNDTIEDAFPSNWKTGSVMALHTAGDLLNFHPHIHSLGLHGAVDPDWKSLQLDSIDSEYLTRQFANHGFDALLEAELLDKETVAAMKCWEHSCFNVFVGAPVTAHDSDAMRESNSRLQVVISFWVYDPAAVDGSIIELTSSMQL